MRAFGSRIALVSVVLLALTASGQSNSGDSPERSFRLERLAADDWSHHVRLGALIGFNASATFKLNGDLGIVNGQPGVYDDGYVRVDDTGNALGYTTFWGYDNASQLSGSTLTLTRTTSFSASSSSEVGSGISPGLEFAYGDSYWRWGNTRIGWEFGFGWLMLGFHDSQTLPSTLSRVHDRFDASDLEVIPDAPYFGPFISAGQPAIFADSIGSTADAVAGTLEVSRKLDASLFTFKLGPSVCIGLAPRLGLYASAGPALGFVTGDFSYTETTSAGVGSSQNQGNVGVNSVVFGGYVNAVLAYHIPSENADIYVGAQYLPLGDVNVSSAGREARLDLSGQVMVSAGVNWRF